MSGKVIKLKVVKKKFLFFRMTDTQIMSCFANEFSNPVDKLVLSLSKRYEHFVIDMETGDSLPQYRIIKARNLKENRTCQQH